MTREIKYSIEVSFKIEYNYRNHNSSNIGTGFFIKGQDGQVFLVTAKHTFSERDRREDDKWKDVKLEELTKHLASKVIVKKNNKKICDVNSIAFEYEDLIVFNVSSYNAEVENIKILYKEEYKKPNFFFYGFCKKLSQEKLFSPTPLPDNDYLYTIQDNQSNTIQAIKGCSGAGVFSEEDGEFYLVGMLLQRYDAGASFTVFNLPKYLKESYSKGFYIFTKDEILIEAQKEKSQLKVINIKNNFENFQNYGTVYIHNDTQSEGTYVDILVDEVDKKESHIILRDGYIEPRTVYIEELNIYVAVCPVTFEEYDLFCDMRNYKKPKSYSHRGKRGKLPVVHVSWSDVNEYCQWLSEKSNKIYKLPTVNEWETIARKNMPLGNLSDFMWHNKNATEIKNVGETKIGKLGIFDMYGNVHEWCADNGIKEETKISKGGSFLLSKELLCKIDESVEFLKFDDEIRELGFRVVCEWQPNPNRDEFKFLKKLLFDTKSYKEFSSNSNEKKSLNSIKEQIENMIKNIS